MSSSPINRRRFVSLSTASVGSIALSSSLAFALSPIEARRLICEIVHQHFPETLAHRAEVEQFAQDLLARRVDSLEPSGFVQAELRSLDTAALERFVVVQFGTSAAYLEIVGNS